MRSLNDEQRISSNHKQQVVQRRSLLIRRPSHALRLWKYVSLVSPPLPPLSHLFSWFSLHSFDLTLMFLWIAWPAIWTVGPNWPNSGEIDIIEGVNNANHNRYIYSLLSFPLLPHLFTASSCFLSFFLSMTLHSKSGCTMPASRSETGSVASTNCDAAVNGNQALSFPLSLSFFPSSLSSLPCYPLPSSSHHLFFHFK